jgi:delta-aminolevulinic acid dehydratase/porphobilinogen synthase
MQPLKIFNIKRAISKVKYTSEGRLVVIDEENTVRIFDLNAMKLDGGFKIKLPKNRIFANSVDISQDGEHLIFTVSKTNKAVLWKTSTKKPSANLGWHKGEIESVAFDIQNKYVATGGTDGRAYIWNIKTGKMVGSLAPHADYVTAIAFSKNGYWCATGSYDKAISITNISSMQFAYKIRAHSTMVTKIKFLNNFKMVSGDKEGNIIVSDYSKGRVLKRVPKLPDIALDFTFNTDEKYMFATTKNKNIFLFDMEKYDLITDKFINVTSTITSIDFVPEMMYLIVGTVDGILYIYDILSDEKKLKHYIEEKKYTEAYDLIEENPLLKNSTFYSRLEQIWENIVSKAHTFLEQGQKDVANQILKPFMSIPSKRMFIQQLLKDFAEFDKFKLLVTKKKYPLAYSLANKYSSFKDTKYYKHMENEWKKAFNMARQLIFEKNKEDYVKQLLMPFRGVSEKTPLIQSLFNEKEIYQLLKQKLAKKDFKGFFELIHRFPFLADLDEYKETLNFGERLLNAANENIKKGNYAAVLKYVNILKDFPIIAIITDLCFCEFTDHGHCGIINPKLKTVDNDATLEISAKQALVHAKAGADMIAPSGMMDNIIETLREALDSNGFSHIPIMSYSTKFASAFYGPFRDAAESTPVANDYLPKDRKTYQMDIANSREALLESLIDEGQGADVLMVKPALAFMDIIKAVKENTLRPLCVYNVSGEYSMVKAAEMNGWMDYNALMMEILTSFKRAGADMIISYHSKDAAKILG